MKKHLFPFVLPLTIVIFSCVTKWWYALPVDGPDTLFWGFPFIFLGEGWHTSMSYQFFIDAFVADFLIYFICLLSICAIFRTYLEGFYQNKRTSIVLWGISFIFITGFGGMLWISNTLFKVERPYNVRVMTSGYLFLWQHTQRPDYAKFNS